MELSRRDILIGLAASAPMAAALNSDAVAADTDTPLIKVSRVIVGRDDLDPTIAKRIYDALSPRIAGFDDKLSRLAAALGKGKGRDEALGALDKDNLDFALQIAKPWYVGIVGEGAEHSFEDDAVFVTFLGAQSFALVADALPMQTYPIGRPGWWADPPAGVKAPPMPDGVRDWAFVPPGAAGPVAAPDPKFLELVTPKSPPGDVLNFQRGTKHK